MLKISVNSSELDQFLGQVQNEIKQNVMSQAVNEMKEQFDQQFSLEDQHMKDEDILNPEEESKLVDLQCTNSLTSLSGTLNDEVSLTHAIATQWF